MFYLRHFLRRANSQDRLRRPGDVSEVATGRPGGFAMRIRWCPGRSVRRLPVKQAFYSRLPWQNYWDCPAAAHLDSHKFVHSFLLLDYIFLSEEIQTRFPVVLGTDFLKKCCLRTQWTLDGFKVILPKAIKLPKVLYIHPSGSCISDSASRRCWSKSGYGMHFFGFPQEAN